MKIENRVNRQIREKEVRLVSMPDGYEDGVYSIESALVIANELGMDLIEISNKSNPVVCKIMELSKFKYLLKQKQKEIRVNQKESSVLKEIYLSPEIGDHDLDTKAKKAIECLSKGNKVKVAIKFKGRSIVFKDRGEIVMLNFANKVQESGVPESLPRMEGKMMFYILKPKK